MAAVGSAFDWFLPISPREMPAVRLFCFPHAGGSTASFSHWPGKLSQDIDVVAISPPGRGSRMGEPLPDDIAAMVDLLVSDQGGFINGQMLQINGGAATQY